MMKESVFLTAPDAADILGLTRHAAHYLVRTGKLVSDAETLRGQRLFRWETVEKLAAERREAYAGWKKVGRPRKLKEGGTK